MADNRDLVLPILQKMQADMTALRAKVDDIAEGVTAARDEIGDLKTFVTFHVGRTTETESIVDSLRKDLADLKRRVAVLESRS